MLNWSLVLCEGNGVCRHACAVVSKGESVTQIRANFDYPLSSCHVHR